MFKHEKIFDFEELVCETLETGRTYTNSEGLKLPSITTVLGHLSNDFLESWRKRVGVEEANKIGRQAALNGTFIHEVAEDILNNKKVDESKLLPDKMLKIRALRKAFQNITKVHAQEIPLYSKFLGVAGRCDCVAVYNGKISIIDFKTSRRYKSEDQVKSYYMQTCAYAIMFEELTGVPIKQLVIMMAIDGEPEPSVFIGDRDEWYPSLKSTIESYLSLK